MIEYPDSTLVQNDPMSWRLLAASTADLGGFNGTILRHAEGSVADAIRRMRPDALLLDAHLAGPEFDEIFADPLLQDLQVLALVSEQDADAAGWLLSGPNVDFAPAGASARTIREGLRGMASRLEAREATGIYGHDRLTMLQRETERVAAALAELAANHPATEQPVDAARIRAHIRARRLRDRFLPPELLADPAWDMLLDLSAARLERRAVSVSSLCIAAAVPTTTALRWIKNLTDQGLIERRQDPTDARRAFIALTPPAVTRMDACLHAVLNCPGQ